MDGFTYGNRNSFDIFNPREQPDLQNGPFPWKEIYIYFNGQIEISYKLFQYLYITLLILSVF